MLLTIAASLLAQETITYETLAKRVPVILQELEPRLKRKLVCDGVFKNEVLVLRADRVPGQDLLDRIAEVSVGKWEAEEGGRLVLRPDVGKRKQQEAARMDLRVKTVQAILDKLKSELASPFDRPFVEAGKALREVPGDPENVFASFRRTPVSRLAMRALLSLGAAKLAKIEEGQRLVLSTRPTKMQIAIPNLESDFATFSKEQSVYEMVVSGDPNRFTIEGSSIQNNRKNTLGETIPKLEEIRISIGDISNPYARITVTTVLNTVVAWNNLLIGRASSIPLDMKSEEPKTLMQCTAESLALNSLLSRSSEIPHPVAPPGSVLARQLRDPEKFDPLSYGSEVCLEFARNKGCNLAMLVGDRALGRFIDEKVAMLTFDLRCRSFSVRRDKDGWITYTPMEPVEERREREDRSGAAALLKGADDLDTRARYVLKRPYGAACGVGARIAGTLYSSVVPEDFVTSEDVLRLYATLSSAQRLQGGLASAEMSAVQREIADRLIFGMPGEYREQGRRFIPEESTSVFPDGLSSGLFLRFTDTQAPALRQVYRLDGDRQLLIDSSPSQAAIEWFWEENPQYVQGPSSASFKASKQVLSTKRTLSFILPADGKLEWFAQASGHQNASEPTHPRDFSDPRMVEIKKVFDQFVQLAKEGKAPVRPDPAANRRPPPP